MQALLPPELHTLHQKAWESLHFSQVLQSHRRLVYLKILETHIAPKYASCFAGKDEAYEQYWNTVIDCIFSRWSKDRFDLSTLKELYDCIYVPLYPRSRSTPWLRIRGDSDVGVTIDNKRVDFVHSQFIIRDMEVAILKYHQHTKEYLVDDIFTFALQEMVFCIHPFHDNNCAFGSILLDILLLDNGMLPIAAKDIIKNEELFFSKDKKEHISTWRDMLFDKYNKYSY